MARTTIKQLKQRRLAGARAVERAEFDETYAAAALAIRVGEQIRDAREAAELSQRELAQRMGTSQAAIARLEAGGVGATLTTLQRAASRAEPRHHRRAPSRELTPCAGAQRCREWIPSRVHRAEAVIRARSPSSTKSADLRFRVRRRPHLYVQSSLQAGGRGFESHRLHQPSNQFALVNELISSRFAMTNSDR